MTEYHGTRRRVTTPAIEKGPAQSVAMQGGARETDDAGTVSESPWHRVPEEGGRCWGFSDRGTEGRILLDRTPPEPLPKEF